MLSFGYLLANALGAGLAFGIIRLGRGLFYRLALNSTGVLNVMLGDMDEDLKLKALEGKTLKLIVSLLAFIGLLIIATMAYLLVVFSMLAELNLEGNGVDGAEGWQVILGLSIGATIPFLIPFKKTPSGYSELAILLHRMVLDNYHLGLKLHQRELKKRAISTRKDFVIVSGLARAGTTSFMNALAENSAFKSLNYSNMPFLLAPNTWARFSRNKGNDRTKERSHKDGIQIGMDSNEALEEYFWKMRAADQFIQEDQLAGYRPTEEDQGAYLSYQSLVRRSADEIYLAKNNNFLLRYAAVREQNRDFHLVVLFRHPLSHAASLLEKHEQYLQLQEEDPFVLDYMNWLGHHEFGQAQKPFAFEEGRWSKAPKDSLDFYLESWINYYRYAFAADGHQLHFVAYEDYCKNPVRQLNRVKQKLQVNYAYAERSPYINQRKLKEEKPYNPDLLGEAEGLYHQLLERCRD